MIAHVRGIAQHLEGLQKRVEDGLLGRDDVDEKEPAAGREHAMRLDERLLRVGEVVRAEPARHHVERAVGEGQGLGVATLGRDVPEAELFGAEPGLLEHLVGEVDRDHLGRVASHGVGRVTGAAADVERALRGECFEARVEGFEVGTLAVDEARPGVVLGDGAELALHGGLQVGGGGGHDVLLDQWLCRAQY